MTQLEPSPAAPGAGPPPLRVAAAPPLTPVQQEVLDQLGSTARPRFRDDLRDHLTAELTDALTPSFAPAVNR